MNLFKYKRTDINIARHNYHCITVQGRLRIEILDKENFIRLRDKSTSLNKLKQVYIFVVSNLLVSLKPKTPAQYLKNYNSNDYIKIFKQIIA